MGTTTAQKSPRRTWTTTTATMSPSPEHSYAPESRPSGRLWVSPTVRSSSIRPPPPPPPSSSESEIECCPRNSCFNGGKRTRLSKVCQVILGAAINLALLGLFVLHFSRNGFKRREWLWIILICMAAIIATYAFLLAKCIYDRSCNRANKGKEEQNPDQGPQVVNHNDPIIC